MKRTYLSLLLAALLLLTVFPWCLVQAEGETVGIEINDTNFPDQAFRNFISSEIDKNPQNGFLDADEIENTEAMDVSELGCESLTGIEYFTSLKRLDCSSNNLTSLDVSANTALTFLQCGANKLTGLDVSANTALDTLRCGSNQLASLDVSGATELTFCTAASISCPCWTSLRTRN